jgi:spermidine synthase
MKPRKLIATAIVPGGGEELRLFRRGDDFMIVLAGNELMSSRTSGSEEALAVMTCARLRNRRAPHVLIGGYGLGFTLRTALEVLPPEASLTVVELVPEIIAWARGPMSEITAGCLEDPRVDVLEADVATRIGQARDTYDAILLDVDNGPDGLTRRANDRLYSRDGLARAKSALKPGGVLAVWSASANAAFTRNLKASGFAVELAAVRARSNGKGPRHTIWFAKRP